MKRPEKDEIYRHFKGREYRIICIAENTESGIEEVVYQALYEPYRIYARDLDMFVSEVDRNKYPNEKQQYRFELVVKKATDTDGDIETINNTCIKADLNSNSESIFEAQSKSETEAFTKKEVLTEVDSKNKTVTEESISDAESEEKADIEKNEEDNPLIRFFNCDDYESQLTCLTEIKDKLDEKMLTNIEFSLGMCEQKGSVLDRYLEIKKYIMVKQKFEKEHR